MRELEYLRLEVAIIGGGIAGLTTAAALRKAGHRVTVERTWRSEYGLPLTNQTTDIRTIDVLE